MYAHTIWNKLQFTEDSSNYAKNKLKIENYSQKRLGSLYKVQVVCQLAQLLLLWIIGF